MTTAAFQKKILAWYRDHHRNDLPWRKTVDPYRILVSEIMLQQTQVGRVSPYYQRFVRRFPTVQKLAAASLREVLRVWSGLGYNRRAKFLHDAARIIIRTHESRVPHEPALLEALPGVGPYTARAVFCFSGGVCEPFLETNIRRVILHFFFSGRGKVSDTQLLVMLRKIQPKQRLREWYLALMDYGATGLSNIPNPNRRSQHYTKQSTFQGSNRYYRGAIVRELLGARAGMQIGLLASRISLSFDSKKFQHALRGLVHEGMVRCPSRLTKSAKCAMISAR